MHSILLGSTNPGKIAELKIGLKDLSKKNIALVDLNQFSFTTQPEENGQTFLDNAFIKASFYADKTRLPVIGDDGGLSITALSGEPGVKSRRWPGYSASDEELIEFCLQKMRFLKGEEREAKLNVHLCFYDSLSKIRIDVYEEVKGFIAQTPSKKRIKGYPFRSLFIVDQFQKYYDELTEQEHSQINHRIKASQDLAGKILERFKL